MENDFVLRMYKESREKLTGQLNELDNLIAKRKSELMAEFGRQAAEITRAVEPDDFRGMKTALAIEKYLRQRGGGPIQIARLAADLAVGGADLGPDPKWHEKNIKTTANSGKNRDILRYDKATDTVSLVNRTVTPKPPGRARGPKP